MKIIRAWYVNEYFYFCSMILRRLMNMSKKIATLITNLFEDLGYTESAQAPGIVDTPLYGGMSEDQRQVMYQGIAKQLPVGRVAPPQGIAYLAKNRFTPGTSVLIDGGAHLT